MENRNNQKAFMQGWAAMMTASASEKTERALPLNKVANARELGGLIMSDGRRIKNNRLLRTAHLADADEADVAYLRDVCGLSLVADLRGELEHEVSPDVKIPGAREIWADLAAEQMQQALKTITNQPDPSSSMEAQMMASFSNPMMQEFMRQFYVSLISDGSTAKELGRVFREILKQEGKAVLWHCTQGKDRCGLMSALMLGALGADRETILHDFALSCDSYRPIIGALEQKMTAASMDRAAIETMYAMIGVNESYMTLALDKIYNGFGSVGGYLAEFAGVGMEEQEQLRAYYLE